MPQLSIIIINFRSLDLISDLLSSFNSHDPLYEIIIVDNSGEGKSVVERFIEKYPFVRWIDMGYNAGFARANNKGIQEARADTVLLLNPDTIVVDNAIERILQAFRNSNYVACGVQLLNADGTPQISGNYAMKGGLNYLLPLPYTGAFLKWMGELFKVQKPNVPNASGVVEVDWINGAFLMVKRTAIDKAGMLDEDFFLYAEEAEWCSRLKRQGALCIYGDQKVIHLQGETANDAFNTSGKGYYDLYTRKGLQIMLSNFVRIRKEFGVGWFLLDLLVYSVTIFIFLIVGILHNIIQMRSPFKHIGQWLGYTKNVFQLWYYSPQIIHGRPYFYKVL